jgi:hypothetical protein
VLQKRDPVGIPSDTLQPILFLVISCIFCTCFRDFFVPAFVISFMSVFVFSFVFSFVPAFVLAFVPAFVPAFVFSFVFAFVFSFVPDFVLVGTSVTWSRALISHSYDDSSAAYLGTAILTIL